MDRLNFNKESVTVTHPSEQADPAAYRPSIAVLGGTGNVGNGLARRWATAGLAVTIGSRSAERAQKAAAGVNAQTSLPEGTTVRGAALVDAAAAADVVVLAVPWEAHAETCAQVRDRVGGKILVDVVNPLGFDERGPYALAVSEGSAAEQAQGLLPDARVVAAFHHVSSVLLADPDLERVETDVMVLGDDREATDRVRDLAGRIPGMRGIFAGRLRNAGQVEALTANLIAVNRRYKTHAGIALTNVEG